MVSWDANPIPYPSLSNTKSPHTIPLGSWRHTTFQNNPYHHSIAVTGCLGSLYQNIKIFLLAAILVRWAPSFVDKFFWFFLTFQATSRGYTWDPIKEHLTLMASLSSFSSSNRCLRRMLTLSTHILVTQPPVYQEANSINSSQEPLAAHATYMQTKVISSKSATLQVVLSTCID
jgi:hypothetical protein